ncbi:MAG: amidohydrolase family protein [Gemmatimonadaceae bacterium]
MSHTLVRVHCRRALVVAGVALAAATRPAALPAQDSARVDTAARAAGPRAGELPLAMARPVRFTTDEGTWISLDVSPSQTIVFEILGDLYTMPMAGGRATRITEGPGFDSQPRYSPDGKQIVFVSDRSGSENLWIADADGKNPRALTRGDRAKYASPEWTPDGRYVVSSRSFSTSYDLWLYHKDGGSGIRLTGAAPQAAAAQPGGPPGGGAPTNLVGAAFGNDGRYIYVAGKQGGFGYNLQLPQWQVYVYDRETGRTFVRTSAGGSAMRPVLSHDGKYMVYATRHDTATALRLRDMTSGDEQWLAYPVQRDDQESSFSRDLMPGSAFTPDGKALVTSYGGKIWRVEVPSGRASPIPFTAEVDQRIGPLVKFEYKFNDSTLTVAQVRGAAPSPDGRQLAFTALDKLWVMDLPGCPPARECSQPAGGSKPRRLTSMSAGEHSATWSPDGRYITFVTWSEAEGGDVYRVRVAPGTSRERGAGAPERLTRQSAFYSSPTYTPDGSKILVARGPRRPRILEEGAPGIELHWLPAAGGATTLVAPLGNAGRAHFTRDPNRVYVYDGGEGLVSMRLDGTDRKALFRVTGFTPPQSGPTPPTPQPASEILISPDGDRAIALVNNNVYLVTVPAVGGQTPAISVLNQNNAPVPIKRLTRVGGDFLGWSPDGKRIYWSLGHSFFSYDVARADSLVRDSVARADSTRRLGAAGVRRVGARDSAQVDTARAGRAPGRNVALSGGDSARVARSDSGKKSPVAYEPDRVDVLITVPRDRPSGTVVLRGARIVTMRGDEIIENGDVVVTGNRIAAVGPNGSISLPAGAREIDVRGKTIIPGWVDIHAHLRPAFGIHKTQVWEYMANLAYGVTTTRDPQTGTTDVLSYGDLVETGDILGPRIFSTGPGVFVQENISSLDEAREVLRRYSDYYNTHTIKQYMVGDRKQRQWVIMAAKELGLMPTTEGGLDLKMNITELLDGYPGHEHSYPIVPLYKDFVTLAALSGITYTPTLLVVYGGPWTENYFYEKFDIHADTKLGRFTPHAEIDDRALRRPGWFREDQYVFPKVAESAKRIVEAGGRVGLGGHGQLQGLGVHWELWAIASGGMKPMDVLRVGTIFGAEAIGLGKDIGSLEPGKLADLQVLDANPLDKIENSNTIRYVMKNGRLYEGNTLKEIWPREREITTPWWWNQEPKAVSEGGNGSGKGSAKP